MRLVGIYAAVRSLSSLLAFDFTFPPPESISSLPEIRLASLLVIAVKLYHPFDSLPRYVKRLTETAILTVDWDIWRQTQKDYDSQPTADGKLGRGSEIAITEDDVFSMSGKQLDGYLDWYEKTWIDEARASQALPQQLLDMFPTRRLDGPTPSTDDSQHGPEEAETAITNKLHAVQSRLEMRGVVSSEIELAKEESVRRIGSSYKHYRRENDLPPAVRVFYEAMARVVGVTVATLVKAVFRTEREIQKWREQQLKREGPDDPTRVSQDQVEDLGRIEEGSDESTGEVDA